MLPRNDQMDLLKPAPQTTSAPQESQDTHRAFVDGIEICAERFPRDEEKRVACFADVVSSTIGRRPSKRTGTAIPVDTTESHRRGSANAHAALRAKRAAAKAAAGG
jgi:hypothetical protein